MDLDLTNKTALITGSTSGIGFAIAKTLAAEGATVLVNGRTEPRAAAAAAKITEGRAIALAGDVSSAEGTAQLVARAREVTGGIDILVNNTGVFEPKAFEDITDEEWLQTFELNVMSGIRLSRAVMEEMTSRGFGRIIFVSSESGINIPVEMVQYGLTKTAQLSVARGLAKRLAKTGVTVNSVLPGPTWTEGVADFVAKIAEQEGKDFETMKATFVEHSRPGSLIGRFIDPQEVADAVAYLCSPRASATTGSSLRVEGGLVDTPW